MTRCSLLYVNYLDPHSLVFALRKCTPNGFSFTDANISHIDDRSDAADEVRMLFGHFLSQVHNHSTVIVLLKQKMAKKQSHLICSI